MKEFINSFNLREKISIGLVLFGIIVFFGDNIYFGWHLTSQSKAESIWDAIYFWPLIIAFFTKPFSVKEDKTIINTTKGVVIKNKN